MEKKMEALKKNVEREKKESEVRGIKKGEERGRKELKQEIARELLILGIDDKTIIASTGLTRQWLGRIKKEIENEKPNKK